METSMLGKAGFFTGLSKPALNGMIDVVKGIEPETGYVLDLKIIKEIIKEEVEERFDHKNLNLDTKEFAHLNPTAENIIVVIYDLIRAKLDSKYELFIKLWETEKNIVEYPVK